MDYIGMIISFGTGIMITGAALYTYAKSQSVISERTAQELETVKSAYSDLQGDIKNAFGNTSITEVGKVSARAKELAVDGYNSKELFELGKMAIDAMKK